MNADQQFALVNEVHSHTYVVQTSKNGSKWVTVGLPSRNLPKVTAYANKHWADKFPYVRIVETKVQTVGIVSMPEPTDDAEAVEAAITEAVAKCFTEVSEVVDLDTEDND